MLRPERSLEGGHSTMNNDHLRRTSVNTNSIEEVSENNYNAGGQYHTSMNSPTAQNLH